MSVGSLGPNAGPDPATAVASPEPAINITDVAVGVLQRPDGSVLYAQRPVGKVYEGWWEFPGGKAEQGEPIEQTLVRELQEELGVTVTRFTPWVIRDHVYTHATVRLHFFRVTQWLGEPASSEGQLLQWQNSSLPAPQPLLPAAIPVIDWLVLPIRYIKTRTGGGNTEGINQAIAAIKARIARYPCLIQLFEPALSDDLVLELYLQLKFVLNSSNSSRLLVHGIHRHLIPHAASGVHLDSTDLMACQTRPDGDLVGAECQAPEHLARAAALGLDFVVMQPDIFARVGRTSRLPVFAVPQSLDLQLVHLVQTMDCLMLGGAHGIFEA